MCITHKSTARTADAAWDTAHAGMKEVTFTAADLSGNTRFTCDLTHSIGAFGSVSVDNTFKVSVTRSVADANDTLVLAEGNLSVVTEENIYELQDNSLIASSSLLNGTLTATSWVYNSEPEKIVEFKYNAAGLRVQKDVTINGITETTKYILRGKQIAEMICGENKLHFFYDEKNIPIYVNLNGTYYSYAHNELGDIIGIYDNSGLIIVNYKYDAWGNGYDITDTSNKYLGINNPLRYNGYIWDPDVQLYYLENRFYNSKVSRFISSDYIHLPAYSEKNRNIFLNSYAYCKNNPIMEYDPAGLWSLKKVLKIAVTGLIIVGAVTVTVCTAGTATAAIVGTTIACATIDGAISAKAAGGDYVDGALAGAIGGTAGCIVGHILRPFDWSGIAARATSSATYDILYAHISQGTLTPKDVELCVVDVWMDAMLSMIYYGYTGSISNSINHEFTNGILDGAVDVFQTVAYFNPASNNNSVSNSSDKSSLISKIDLSKNNYWYRGPYRHKFIALSY